MAFRFYIVPSIGTGETSQDARRPKYFGSGEALAERPVSWKDYGREGRFVVGGDLITSDDSFVVAQPDVIAVPTDMAAALTLAQRNTVRSTLEAVNIPGNWVQTGDTWVHVIRVVLGVFEFMARFEAIYGAQTGEQAPSLSGTGVNLDRTFSSLPAAVQAALIGTADSYGIDHAAMTGSTTLRTILRTVADFFDSRQYNFAGTLI